MILVMPEDFLMYFQTPVHYEFCEKVAWHSSAWLKATVQQF